MCTTVEFIQAYENAFKSEMQIRIHVHPEGHEMQNQTKIYIIYQHCGKAQKSLR